MEKRNSGIPRTTYIDTLEKDIGITREHLPNDAQGRKLTRDSKSLHFDIFILLFALHTPHGI